MDSAKFDTVSLRKVSADRFSDILKFKFSGLIKRYKNSEHTNVQFSRKKCFFLVHMSKFTHTSNCS